jgi:hypothetical protein
MNSLNHSILRRITRGGLGIILSLAATATMAHAHGGMAGPDELGPPLFTSAALAFVCYWVVVLWPASKQKGSDGAPGGRGLPLSEDRRRAQNKRIVSGRTSQLRGVETNRARDGSTAVRKASNV